jgi:hypothetical protein
VRKQVQPMQTERQLSLPLWPPFVAVTPHAIDFAHRIRLSGVCFEEGGPTRFLEGVLVPLDIR